MEPMVFSMKDVMRLLVLSFKANDFRPTYGNLYDENLRKPGVTLKEGEFPTEDMIDTTKIEPGLILVGDQGVYLISNSRNQQKLPGKKSLDVAYARGANPDVDEDFYEMKRAMFGGDDGTQFLPATLFERALEENHTEFVITVSDDGDELFMESR